MRDLVPATLALLLAYAAVAAPLVWRLDYSVVGLIESLVLATTLCALSAVDLRDYRLPDALTMPLMLLGWLASWRSGVTPPWWPLASAAIGFAALAGLAYAYRTIRRRPGLGLGDAKLLAASGAWLGAQALPSVLLWATGPALVLVVLAYWRGSTITGATRIPFGPFLGFATWLVWLYGPL